MKLFEVRSSKTEKLYQFGQLFRIRPIVYCQLVECRQYRGVYFYDYRVHLSLHGLKQQNGHLYQFVQRI